MERAAGPELFDPGTATVLAQVLPLLLISLMVELRRVGVHVRGARRRRIALLAIFFALFGLVESGLVLLIDGRLLPLRIGDLVSALIIFGLLALLFGLSLAAGPRDPGAADASTDDP